MRKEVRLVRNSRTDAFTLVELLVVIAIILILACLAMGGLSVAKDHARTTVCRSNLRQLGLAVKMYVDDNNDCMPGASQTGQDLKDWIYWNDVDGVDPYFRNLQNSPIRPYLGQLTSKLLRCPSDADPRYPQFTVTGIASAETGPPFRFSSIYNPCEKVLMVDKMCSDRRLRFGILPNGVGTTGGAYVMHLDKLGTWHRGKGGVALADGHVEMVRPPYTDQYTHMHPWWSLAEPKVVGYLGGAPVLQFP